MNYDKIKAAVFIDRPNRFIANIKVDGKPELCHVKNTGRCRELLLPGADIWIQESEDPKRKTRFDLIAVQKGRMLVNVDAAAPNKAVQEWLTAGGLFKSVSLVRPETVFGHSRLDFYVEADGRKFFIEVKGATLEEEGVIRFPDAPTERGLKHIHELVACRSAGYEALIIFVVQMKGDFYFEPNRRMHAAFADALKAAAQAGVGVLAYDCRVTPHSMEIAESMEVRL
jgi:sugar fermentation stimulation protein A